MPERECDLGTGGLNKYLVKPGLRRGLNCELVVRRGAQCAGGAGSDAEAAFSSSSAAGVAVVRVDNAHRQNVLRILVCMLAGIENLEFALRKIAHRIMVPVSRNHIQHHLARGDMKDQGDLSRSRGRRFLCRHRKAERGYEAERDQKTGTGGVGWHARNFTPRYETSGREFPEMSYSGDTIGAFRCAVDVPTPSNA